MVFQWCTYQGFTMFVSFNLCRTWKERLEEAERRKREETKELQVMIRLTIERTVRLQCVMDRWAFQMGFMAIFFLFLLHFVRLFIRCTSFSVPASPLKWIIGCLTLWTWMRIRSCQRCFCTWLKRARPRSASSSLSRPTTSSCLELSSPMSTGETVHSLLPFHPSLHFGLI